MILLRGQRRRSLVAVLLLTAGAVGGLPGCGPGPASGEKMMVKDPPPMPEEETTEAFLKNQVKARGKARPNVRARRG